MNQDLLNTFKAIEAERGIPVNIIWRGVEVAILEAYQRNQESRGADNSWAEVELDQQGEYHIYKLDIPEEIIDKITIEVGGRIDSETGIKVNTRTEIDRDRIEQYRDSILRKEVTPKGFGRIAASAARQAIHRYLNRAGQDLIYEEWRSREGELIVGSVQAVDAKRILVSLGRGVEAVLPSSEQISREHFARGNKIHAIVKSVERQEQGCAIYLSRKSPDLVRELFFREVPEIQDGLVEIVRVVREAGEASKVGVIGHGVDALGACVGTRGSRIRGVVSELKGEKLDLVPLDQDPSEYLVKALQPAKVKEILLDEDQRFATVIVPDDQLSKAIGQGGFNVRLASWLTDWQIEVKSVSSWAQEEPTAETDVAENRCHAVMQSGKRCPNIVKAEERYCGLDSHQALASEPALESEPALARGFSKVSFERDSF
jgi:N utilization substance protein A